MLFRAVCTLAVFATVLVDAKTKGTFPALDKKNPVCTYAVDQVRIKGEADAGTPKFLRKFKACKGPQGYAIRDCQLKQCQCRKFHTHVADDKTVTSWAECLPKVKDSTSCVGADLRFCDNLLRGRDPIHGSGGGSNVNGRNVSQELKSATSRSGNAALRAGGNASDVSTKSGAAEVQAAGFPVVAVVLASVGVMLAIVLGTYLVVSKKKAPKSKPAATTSATGGNGGGGASLEFDEFDDDDHRQHKDLYADAHSTAAAVHTVAVPAPPPPRRLSSSSVSSVSDSDDDDDDDDTHAADHDDSWTAYSKK
ncbi:Aste57867_24997 [Aphanomyces stellatus]|uniref:Aste57867_24997 protein n=1 Tax=Aphanomyces stellatus TaxID=120398 RepID=A0A485LU26_9STRA|nr:hypothetical protein As57867_024919 [Aphanomyces stellatus]VFU01628.1 Aste57867_24997 [Aphanomyces stellatus]